MRDKRPALIATLYRTLTGLLLCLSASLSAQLSPDIDPYALMDDANQKFASGLFRAAYDSYDNVCRNTSASGDPELYTLTGSAALGRAKSALHCGLPDAELQLRTLIIERRPEPIATEATMYLANYFYNSGEHESAVSYYATLKTARLDAQTLSEARFKQGYCHFVRKEFPDALLAFTEVKEIKTEYYYPSNYYLGMCQFYLDDHDGALASFERASQSDRYRDHVPCYIAQIYFARKAYSEVISYAEPKLGYTGLKSREELRQLIGRAWFETGDFTKAKPYLEAYAASGGQMRAEDFYQLAFVQYQAGDCTAAIGNFKNIAFQQNVLGQRSNFYMASCFLNTGDLQGAYNAFGTASRMDHDIAVKTEALLQYGKVAAQLSYDAEAIRALDAIPSNSSFYQEAQDALRGVFQSSRDYASTLRTLELMPQLSPALKSAYQEVSLYRGLQLLHDNRLDEANTAFLQVGKYPLDHRISAQALYWRAELMHRKSAYEQSADLIRQYAVLARSASEALPLESSPAMASYLQGYNYLHLNNYIQAQSQFTDAIRLMKSERTRFDQTQLKAVLPDALTRAGDCAFKRNLYADARNLYSEAIQLGGPQTVYAKYQRAMIAGLERNTQEKVRLLEGMKIDHPDSDLADDVLMQLGITYHETSQAAKAITVLDRLLEAYPRSDLVVAALLRSGLINYNSGNTQAALTSYKRVFQHQPTGAQGREALTAIEEIYVQDLRTPDDYFAFVASVPGYEISAMKRDSLSYRVAEIQYEQGEYTGAVTGFTEYLQRFPGGINVVPAYFYRGDAQAILKAYSAALKDFETVAMRGPGQFYLDALTRAALLAYNDARDFDKAYVHYSTLYAALNDQTKRHEAALGAVRSAYRAGTPERVSEWYSRVVSDPSTSDAIRAEALYYGARAAMDQKQDAAAIDLFRQVARLAENAQAAESRFRIAQIHFMQGRLDEAEQSCNTANASNGNYPFWVAKSLILISDISVQRKDYFNARAPLEAVLDNFQGDEGILGEARQKLDQIIWLERQESKVHRDTSQTLEMIKDENN